MFRKTEPKEKLTPWRLGVVASMLYAALYVVWLFVYGSALRALSSDAAWVTAAGRYRDWLWAAFTALALGLVVRHLQTSALSAKAAARFKDLQVVDLFFHHPKPMYVFAAANLQFLRVNEAALAFYGYTEAEFLSMTLVDLHPREDAALTRANVSRNTSEYRDVGIVRHRKKSGEVVYANITAHSITDAGRAARMVMAVEVTQQVLAKQALELQERQFRQLHESLAEVLWLASPDGHKVLYVSPAAERLFGHSVASFETNTSLWTDMVHPEDRAKATESVRNLGLFGHADCEYRVVRPDGSIRWVADRKRAIYDSSGRVTMVGGIAEDVTAAKERDSALATTRVELEQMVQSRTEELQQAYAELDAFTRTAAHDLKTPLNGVMGFSQLLKFSRSNVLDEEALRLLTRIEESAQTMASLVDGLLALSRVSTVELNLQRVNLVDLAWGIFRDLGQQEPGREILLTAPDEMWVLCDPRMAHSLISNLVGNAWKYTGKRAHAEITLSNQRVGDDVFICIQDNGAGFNAGDPERVFKPFERFHSLSEFRGTGIGLATCQRIVRRHGGKFRVTSEPGVGTQVWFTLGSPETVRPSRFAAL